MQVVITSRLTDGTPRGTPSDHVNRLGSGITAMEIVSEVLLETADFGAVIGVELG